VNGVEGRRPVVRWRVRDHPVDAGRRRAHLPPDDQHPVPQRRRAGQDTPGPVVATVAAVGYAAHGLAGGLLAALVAFSPSFSFSFILIGGSRFERLRNNDNAQAFLDGAGPAAIGAILGVAIPLAGALHQTWQFVLLALAAVALLAFKRGVVQNVLTAPPRRTPPRCRARSVNSDLRPT
jgi:hypothetical protein